MWKYYSPNKRNPLLRQTNTKPLRINPHIIGEASESTAAPHRSKMNNSEDTKPKKREKAPPTQLKGGLRDRSFVSWIRILGGFFRLPP
jgi:hypothetical protein